MNCPLDLLMKSFVPPHTISYPGIGMKGYRDLFETLPARRAGCFGCGSTGAQLSLLTASQLEGSLESRERSQEQIRIR